jgi:FAD/FMN-containing dehydrogenase
LRRDLVAFHERFRTTVAERGLMIDLSAMRTISVDTEKQTARVGPGALLSDFDRESQAHGLATPLGINSTTGVAGLTLGSGFGWLTRRHGLTIDNLLSATVVTADGAVRVASPHSEPDLFWALRGGGGNFGVVTSFEFQLHPVGPEVYAGLVVYPFTQAGRVLRAWRDFTRTMPDEFDGVGGAAQGAAAALSARAGCPAPSARSSWPTSVGLWRVSSRKPRRLSAAMRATS